MSRILLPSILTACNPHWSEEIQNIKALGLSQVALFLTGLDAVQRQRCYQELRKIPGLIIPFIHARHDMAKEEYKYLSDHFGTTKFNLHPRGDFSSSPDSGEFNKMIYIENCNGLLEKDLANFAGICLDLSHLENWRLMKDERFQIVDDLVKKHGVGVNHLSVIKMAPEMDGEGKLVYTNHYMSSFDEFDYLKHYGRVYFGEYLAIELLNPLSEQLELAAYLNEILKDKGVNSQD